MIGRRLLGSALGFDEPGTTANLPCSQVHGVAIDAGEEGSAEMKH